LDGGFGIRIDSESLKETLARASFRVQSYESPVEPRIKRAVHEEAKDEATCSVSRCPAPFCAAS